MKILCCGSRSYNNIDKIREVLSQFTGDITIIHGAAAGADYLSGEVAKELGFTVKEYPANWERDGKKAGFLRNHLMLQQRPNLVIAFWDGISRGTKHTIDCAKRMYLIKVEIVNL